jgi:hypothetical protein
MYIGPVICLKIIDFYLLKPLILNKVKKKQNYDLVQR